MSRVEKLRTERIRALNDKFRTTFIGGTLFLSEMVSQLERSEQQKLIAQVKTFTDFNEGNDPHKEHDMAFFHCLITEDGKNKDEKFFFKIDYYDIHDEVLSPDPSNAEVTRRILTIAYADEY